MLRQMSQQNHPTTEATGNNAIQERVNFITDKLLGGSSERAAQRELSKKFGPHPPGETYSSIRLQVDDELSRRIVPQEEVVFAIGIYGRLRKLGLLINTRLKATVRTCELLGLSHPDALLQNQKEIQEQPVLSFEETVTEAERMIEGVKLLLKVGPKRLAEHLQQSSQAPQPPDDSTGQDDPS